MSTGKWDEMARPDGERERAELAARLEDAMARLHSAQLEIGVISQLVRELELARRKQAA